MRLAVLKSPVAKQDLERLALQQIRSFPGGEHVIRAEVEYQSDPRKDINWKLHVIAKEGADFERIQYAARTTTDRMKRLYNLRPDS
jgi:hypothetical protein